MGLAFSPDNRHIASVSRDKSARVFDSQTGELEETYTGHTQPVFGVAFRPDGQCVISGGRDKEIHVWQIKDAKKTLSIGGFDSGVIRFTASGDQLFSCSVDSQVRQHQVLEKKAELVRTFSGHRDVVYALAFHEPTKRLASGSFDGEVRLWDVATGRLLSTFIAAPGYRR
jgi:WD40 repeat protein